MGGLYVPVIACEQIQSNNVTEENDKLFLITDLKMVVEISSKSLILE